MSSCSEKRKGEFITGWWLGHPSEKYESIGMIIPNLNGKIKHGNQTTNQIKIFFSGRWDHIVGSDQTLVQPAGRCGIFKGYPMVTYHGDLWNIAQ